MSWIRRLIDWLGEKIPPPAWTVPPPPRPDLDLLLDRARRATRFFELAVMSREELDQEIAEIREELGLEPLQKRAGGGET